METVAEVLSIMLVSAGFFWGGIPMGLAFRLPLWVAGIVTMLGAELAVLAVIGLGSPLQSFFIRRFPLWIEKTRDGRAARIWQNYGMPGLGLLSPVVPGAPQSALIALVLGAKPAWVLLWVSAGILLWGSLFMGGIALGMNAATHMIH